MKISYNNLISFTNWFKKIIPCKRSIILNQASFSFDLSVADLYLALTTGSELFVLKKEIQIDYIKLFNILKNSSIQIAVMTPTFAEMILMDKYFNSLSLPNLNTIYFCGETLSVKTAKELRKRFENTRIINSYGPTECTVAVTSINVTDDITNYNNLPIADFKNDIQNAKIYIVDENMNILQDGKIGEILISGDSVGNGYLDKDQNRKFILFNGNKAYLTGDLGYIENNKLYYKERKDRQIKYKGYRIELSDIEENIFKIKDIKKCKVVPKIVNNKITKIIAYVQLENNSAKTEIELQKEIKKYLPDYMCPKIKILDEFPVNNNGKIDIEKLKEIANGR